MTQQLTPTGQQQQYSGGQGGQMTGGQGGQMTSGQGGQMTGGQAAGGQVAGQAIGMQSSRQQQGGQLPQHFRGPLHTVAQAIQVCGWCADQCVATADPNMIECIRLCEDVVELGETVLTTVPRTSRFSDQIVETFRQAAQACAQECGRHGAAHCQECAAVLDQAVGETQQLGSTGGGMGAGTQQYGTAGSQQFSG